MLRRGLLAVVVVVVATAVAQHREQGHHDEAAASVNDVVVVQKGGKTHNNERRYYRRLTTAEPKSSSLAGERRRRRAATASSPNTPWESMPVEVLARLPEPGTGVGVEAFLDARTTPDANESEWYAYQKRVIALCDPFWALVPPHKRLADYDYYRSWTEKTPRFGKFVYLPLPWHHIVEQHGYLRKDYAPLQKTAQIFGQHLDFDRFDHFITLGQASFPQIHKYCRRGGFKFPNLDKLKLVFTSRYENLDRLAARTRLARHEIPIPLLYEATRETPASGAADKQPRAFFAGSCTCPMRERLGELHSANAYDMTGVHPCGSKIPRPAYLRYLRFSTWVLTPRGSFPAAYMISEAVQSGSLPVYVYDWKHNSSLPLPPVSLVKQHLPFVNLGLDWSKFGTVVTARDIPHLPHILSGLDAQPRLARVRQLRPLFTVDGTFRYILATLSMLAAKVGLRTHHDAVADSRARVLRDGGAGNIKGVAPPPNSLLPPRRVV